ncbi:hypothetical protein [Thiothrix eikelboomii]|uniref:Uncharacterized protein n=1 Tax=Thiothrix eikelboomii TaxID=92487 RepID=A0A1T4X203_9GAMM|nr:hypothetical protein [Thiothrix eikelboomii]SKA83467.1 hypothetical protein SAMN02745130_02406 [Thiothrix eikelboomii]
MSDPKDLSMNHDIRDFRQPMVTSIGIILGFLMNFLAQWAIADDEEAAIQTLADGIVAITLLIGIGLMIFVLFKLLTNRYDTANAGSYYQRIFRWYMASIIVSFGGLAAALFI